MNETLQKRIKIESNKYMEEAIEMNSVVGDNLHYEDLKTCFIEAADFALQNQWISVEEDLPPYDKAVIGVDYMPELAWDDQTIIFVHRSDNPNVVTDKNKFCVYPPRFCKVTYWMEIPSLEGGKK